MLRTQKIFIYESGRRISALEALEHPYISKSVIEKTSSRNSSRIESGSVVNSNPLPIKSSESVKVLPVNNCHPDVNSAAASSAAVLPAAIVSSSSSQARKRRLSSGGLGVSLEAL